MKEIEKGQGGDRRSDDFKSAATDTFEKQTRTQAAEEAGMSKRQMVTSIRVANVPEEEFEDTKKPPPPKQGRLVRGGTLLLQS